MMMGMDKMTRSYRHLSTLNTNYVETLYERFLNQDETLSKDWKIFFEGMEFAFQNSKQTTSSKDVLVEKLIQAYRDDGHLKANLDPLKLKKTLDHLFELKNLKLSENDLKTLYKGKPLSSLIEKMESTYCGTLTVHISDCEPKIRNWFYDKMENHKFTLSPERKKRVLEQIIESECFEKFLHTRFVGAKRFSIEGADSLLPLFHHLLEETEEFHIKEIVIGMAHRGRLSVLTNFMKKNLEAILSYFQGYQEKEENFEGDVKYHLGYSTDLKTKNSSCHICLSFNPSHLESVCPVVLGMTRAKQRLHKDTEERNKVLPLLIHGDAAFIGQGVSSETLQLSELEGYKVGGALHIIINNQLGFTTLPKDGRSTLYASDMAKAIKAPILLVNADDVEACLKAMSFAVQFRAEFKKDVVIDMYCYRRFGHNETDEPSFTQPKIYEIIRKHPSLKTIYRDQLVQESLITPDWVEEKEEEINKELQSVLDKVRQKPSDFKSHTLEKYWKGIRRAKEEDFEKPFLKTSCKKETLDEVMRALSTVPQGFCLHPKIKKLLEKRQASYEKDTLDWGLAELITYGSLCLEGNPVRLTGQDSKRGTFSHRHAIYFDYKNSQEYSPLSCINSDQAEFCIYNSPLSEMAVLGFEYGNSTADPLFLTLWEAQFGDFSNGAQIIIDQFISSGENKWARMSGLTLLLPHGYEGLGPEHSSARIERFLQLCAQKNMQVCNLTTPSNLFHALRRQVKRPFRKPLIIASPKSLLRHPDVVSPLEDFTHGHFQEVLPDPHVRDEKKVSQLVLCSGKIYYDIQKKRRTYDFKDDMAVVRIEQLYPFPAAQLTPFLNGYPKLKTITLAQEEPQNMGPYSFLKPRLQELLNHLKKAPMAFNYKGRPPKASPATGSSIVHEEEQRQIIENILESYHIK